MLLFLREKQGAQETLHTDQNSNRVHGKEKRKKKGERLKRGRTRTVQFTQKETERGRKEKKHCVSLFPRVLSCPSRGGSQPGACGAPCRATGAIHGAPQTVGRSSRAAADGPPPPLPKTLPPPGTGSQPESRASQKNEPEMPLACP